MGSLVKAELADRAYAKRAASVALAQFASLRREEFEIALPIVTDALTGWPKSIVSMITDPRVGLAARNEFYSLSALNRWLDAHEPHRAWKPFKPEEDNWTPLTPEEILRRIEVSRQLVENMKERHREEDRARVGGKPLQWKQVHAPSKLLEALNNLEQMRGVDAGDEAEGEHQAPAATDDAAGL